LLSTYCMTFRAWKWSSSLNQSINSFCWDNYRSTSTIHKNDELQLGDKTYFPGKLIRIKLFAAVSPLFCLPRRYFNSVLTMWPWNVNPSYWSKLNIKEREFLMLLVTRDHKNQDRLKIWSLTLSYTLVFDFKSLFLS